MPVGRYFFPQDLVVGGEVVLDESESHHITRVVRVRPGESVELVNGKGVLAQARLEGALGRKVRLTVVEVEEKPPNRCPMILAQALPRKNRLDALLEKSTELGVEEVWLFPGEKSEKKMLPPHQFERIQTITVSAMKQSGRLFLPGVQMMGPVSSWKKMDHPLFFGTLSKEAPLFGEVVEEGLQGCIFVVGPEGGLTDEEEACLKNLGGRGVSLSNHILRTDTAPLVALSLIRHWQLMGRACV